MLTGLAPSLVLRQSAMMPALSPFEVSGVWQVLEEREIGNLLPNNRRQRRTCYALCHILFPVSAAHTSIFRMDSNSTSCRFSNMYKAGLTVIALFFQKNWSPPNPTHYFQALCPEPSTLNTEPYTCHPEP